jgi:2-polyprenyl-3-methyl-5-hydroxy-6-metoxy-1,4-benzoquinol methylase
MIEIQNCPVCDTNAFTPFLTCHDHSISRENFKLIQCTNCQLVITSPRPSNQQLDKYYTSPAYTSHIAAAKSLFDNIYLTVRSFALKWKLALVEKHTIPAPQKKIFDFGCGTAEFLKVAKQNGWVTIGMEPSHLARKNSDPSVVEDVRPTLMDVINEGHNFTAITLWHVLEHVEDLNTTLLALKALLTENGTIFIAVPNHTSWDGKHYHQNWAGYDVPRHLWHFNKNSMKRLLEKHALTIATIIPMRLDAFYISLLSEKYLHNKSLSILGIAKAIFNAFTSNYRARNTMNYSSLIYVVKK